MQMLLLANKVMKVLRKLSEISSELTKKQEQDEDSSKKNFSKDIMFGCTGTIGEKLSL